MRKIKIEGRDGDDGDKNDNGGSFVKGITKRY